MYEKEAKSKFWEKKVLVFERMEAEVVDRVNMPAVGRCEVLLGGKRMEEVKAFK